MDDLLAALGLVLVIEGLLYAAAPERMKRMAAAIQPIPPAALRAGGVLAAVLGLGVVWLVRRA
jgi:uncharacterized protein YjeT (DUF2065 family)